MNTIERIPGLIHARDISQIKEHAVPIRDVIGITFAGGYGTRMEQATRGLHSKTTLIVGSGALMDSSLALFRNSGLQSLHVLTTEGVIDSQRMYTKDNPLYQQAVYSAEPYEPRGIGPALTDFLHTNNPDRPIIVTNADEQYDLIDLKAVYAEHTWLNHQLTGVLTNKPKGTETDKYTIDPKTKKIITKKKYVGNDQTDTYEGTGLWIIEPTQFPLIKSSLSWHDFLRHAIDLGDVYGHVVNTSVWNVNTPEDLISLRTKRQ